MLILPAFGTPVGAADSLYLEPELAVIPEALRALHEGVAVLRSSYGDVRVGALISEGAHAPLAAIADSEGRCSAAGQPAPGVPVCSVSLQSEVAIQP